MGLATALTIAIAGAALRGAGALVGSVAGAAAAETPEQPTPQTPEQRAGDGAELPKLPPRAPVGGVRLLETTSTLIFAGRESVPHTLTATFAFPERARLHLGTRDAQSGATTLRELRYQYGPAVFALQARKERSSALAGAERVDVLRDLELRRALFLWPDSAAWKGEGQLRTAPAGELGTLRARLAAGRAEPDEVELVLADGTVAVALRRVSWTKEHGRVWPQAFDGWREGALAWHEEVESRETTRTYVDSFFLPPDRRAPGNETDRMLGRVQEQSLPSFVARRVELTRGLDWSAARAEIARLQKEWAERLKPAGLELDPNGTVEVGEALEPVALWVRLAKEPATRPEAFAVVPARSGRVMFLEAIETAPAERLAELRRALPATARTAAPYVRIPAARGPVLLVLPVVPD
jgi:hypothetical protein